MDRIARLLLLLRLEALADDAAIAETTRRLRSSAAKVVISSLHRACTTANPSGEPVNGEAKRQLVFFTNSLHNRRLKRPPTVLEMKSLTAFTPHYAEDVTFSMEALQTAGDDNASLLTILKSLTPDEWANLCERVDDLESYNVTLRSRASVRKVEVGDSTDRTDGKRTGRRGSTGSVPGPEEDSDEDGCACSDPIPCAANALVLPPYPRRRSPARHERRFWQGR